MARIYLSLGSNIGDRKKYLTDAINLLGENPKIKVGKISSVYETKAQGYSDQADFLNMVIAIESDLSPLEILDLGQKIEKDLDRKKLFHWGPRTIDIDIISYDDLQMDSQRLIIPHKEALNRAFVLLPLLEITREDFELNGVKIKEALEGTPHDESIIWLYQETVPS